MGDTNSLRSALIEWRKLTGVSNLRKKFDRDKANLNHLVGITDSQALLLRGCVSTWKLQSIYARVPAAIKSIEEEQQEQVYAEERFNECQVMLSRSARRHEEFSFCCFFILAWRRLLEENIIDNTALQVNARWAKEE